MSDVPTIKFKKDSEHTLEFEIIPLSRLFQQTSPDHDPLKSHRLNFYAIILVTDGSPGTHYIDFKTYEYQKGNLIFIAKEQVHAFSSLQNNAGYIIPFTEDFLTKSVAPEDSVFLQQLFNYQLYHPVVPLTLQQFGEFQTIISMAHHEREGVNDFVSGRILRSYLNLLLILKIKRMLANSSMTVNEVGYEAGFDEPTNFVKFVKKHTRMTPAKLRKTLR